MSGGTAATDTPPDAWRGAPGAALLDGYAGGQWESLLLFLLGAAPPPALPAVLKAQPLDLRQLLASARRDANACCARVAPTAAGCSAGMACSCCQRYGLFCCRSAAALHCTAPNTGLI